MKIIILFLQQKNLCIRPLFEQGIKNQQYMSFTKTIWPLKDRLYRLALRLLTDRSEAEDVVQEVMIKLWQQEKNDGLACIKNLNAWSLRLTKNLALDKLKGGYNKRKTDLDQNFSFKTSTPNPERAMESKDTMAFIKDKMQALPEKYRLVMHLRDIEELSYQEICEALEMSMSEVKSNLFRARKSLRSALSKSIHHG